MNEYTPYITNETVRILRYRIKYTKYTQEREDIPERYQGETKRYHGNTRDMKGIWETRWGKQRGHESSDLSLPFFRH